VNRIDWEATLRHFVQVLAFCLVIATVQYGFQPDKPYGPAVIYSLFIGISIWALIDIGRSFFPSSEESGWPAGLTGVLLVAGGIMGGWYIGNHLGFYVCKAYGFLPPGSVS
jgi:hypothetical protein